jgi:hypothetical protein
VEGRESVCCEDEYLTFEFSKENQVSCLFRLSLIKADFYLRCRASIVCTKLS